MAVVLLAFSACSRRVETADGSVAIQPAEFVDTTDVGDVTDAGTAVDSTGSIGGRIRGVVGRVASAIGFGLRPAVPPYAGTDARGIPRYARRAFTDEERRLLRDVYGIEDPARLYVSDSTEDGLLKYDTRVKRCRACYVHSYRVGFVSVRRRGESWEQAERRVRRMRGRDFPLAARSSGPRSTAELDPTIRDAVERMLADARRAGFAVRVVATYRSPEHEAYLMAIGGRRTLTLTSMHSYGRAIDVVIGDGNIRRAATRRQWIAFRRWVTAYDGDKFRILGTPERTWDWRHVEMPTSSVGFRTIDEAIERARHCDDASCDFPPRLPHGLRRAR